MDRVLRSPAYLFHIMFRCFAACHVDRPKHGRLRDRAGENNILEQKIKYSRRHRRTQYPGHGRYYAGRTGLQRSLHGRRRSKIEPDVQNPSVIKTACNAGCIFLMKGEKI